MLFNSFRFLLVFPIIFLIYWAIPSRYSRVRNGFLLLVSYLLYMNWNPVYSSVLLCVTLITYWGGYLLGNQICSRGRAVCLCFALLALLPLLAFKYYNFLNDNLTSLLKAVGASFELPGLNWAIPVGISFFSFQAVGYLLDVYHDRCAPEKNFWDYALFVSFFPQVTSGPISKADELLPQIKRIRVFDDKLAVSGLRFLLWGMFLKVVVADRAGIYVDMVFDNFQKFSGLNCFAASVIYSIQIYSDFAGYSLMAVGTGKLLGFELVNNFNRPYFSVSITDFWRRWHISLSRWLKDHIYIPLGGSRCSKLRNYWNIFVTFLVSGIWHGANWTFIVWGVIHGLCQIIEKIFGWQNKDYKGVKKFGRIFLTFIVVNFAWIVFRSPNMGVASEFIGQILTFYKGIEISLEGMETLAFLAIAMVPFILFEVFQEFCPFTFGKIVQRRMLRWFAYLIIVAMIILNGVHDGGNFIYVSF